MSDEGKVIPLHRRAQQQDGDVRPVLIYDLATGLYDVLYQGVVTHAMLDVHGERERIRRSPGSLDVEPPHYAQLRAIGKVLRSHGDCGSTVTLDDGTLASFRVETPSGGHE
jgi:hypothetical protein